MKILFISLGCDKNLVDAEKMLGMLFSEGMEFTDAPEEVLWSMLGRGHVRTFRCSSSHREAIVQRA